MAKHYPDNLVGQFIYVFWKDDNLWYRARVIRYLEITKKYKIVYDDKNEEKLDLATEWFLMEDEKLKAEAAKLKRYVRLKMPGEKIDDNNHSKQIQTPTVVSVGGKVLGKRVIRKPARYVNEALSVSAY